MKRGVVGFLKKAGVVISPSPERVENALSYELNPYEEKYYYDAPRSNRGYKITNFRSPSSFRDFRVLSDLEKIQLGNSLIQWLSCKSASCWWYLRVWYFFNKARANYFDSEVFNFLKTERWVPTTIGLRYTRDVFIPSPEIKKVLGKSVPYLSIKTDCVPDVFKKFGVYFELTPRALVSVLTRHLGDSGEETNALVKKIYKALSLEDDLKYDDAYDDLKTKKTIFIPSEKGSGEWVSVRDCIWNDASDVFGERFKCLKDHYPRFEQFFVETLGVKENADEQCYADAWIDLQETPIDDKKEMDRIVGKLYRALKKTVCETCRTKPAWYDRFKENAQIYTQSGEFKDPREVVVPDGDELRKAFNGKVAFVWRPTGDALNSWRSFFQALDVQFLSDVVSVELDGDIQCEEQSDNQYITPSTVKMMASWLREEDQLKYEQFFEEKLFENLFLLKEACVSDGINITYSLSIADDPAVEKEDSVYWDQENKRLCLAPNVEKHEIASHLAFSISRGKNAKNFRNYIENILSSKNTNRLKRDGWNVPKTILDLEKRLNGVGFSEETPLRDISEEEPSEEPVPLPCSEKSDQDSTDELEEKTDVDFSEKLDRPGKIELNDDYEEEEHRSIKNTGRYKEKVDDEIDQSRKDEPPASERRTPKTTMSIECKNPQTRQFLLEWYGGRCQICGRTWAKRNGEPYFVAAYLVEVKNGRWLDHPGNAFCLCADHFAQWCHAAKEKVYDVNQWVLTQKIQNEGGTNPLNLEFSLLGERVGITYCEQHFIRLRGLVQSVEAERMEVIEK